jgi:hypothetical protein
LPEDFTEELIDGRVDVHDSTHFELKLDYSIDSKRKDNSYRVESYFFVPRSLGINSSTYPRQQFYNDVQGYIRLKTPNIPLTTLADADDPLSPLHQLVHLASRLRRTPGDGAVVTDLSHELRLFACVVRAKLRDHSKALRDQMGELERSPESHQVLQRDLEKRFAAFLEQLTSVISAWRELRVDLLAPEVKRSLRETYGFVDEYISLIVEGRLTNLVRGIDDSMRARATLQDQRERARQLLIEERAYRASAGYESVVEEGSKTGNEKYVYRRGMLKKFVMSVLWLEIEKEKEGRPGQLGAVLAAGTAMVVALTAAALYTTHMLVNTAGFFVCATIAYILKDRVKEVLKGYLSSRLAGWAADYSVRIRHPATHADLGHCRESFSYLAPRNVPRPVYDLRHQGDRASIEVLAKPEIVLRYHKQVQLKSRAIIERMHLEDYDVNDIIRFGLRHFLVGADDAEEAVPTYDQHRDQVERRRFPKVYHLNVVMVLRAESAPERARYRRIRVVFNKKGIKRIEKVA